MTARSERLAVLMAVAGDEPGGRGEASERGAARIGRAVAAGRNRLLADANLIDALVRIDEIEVATRAILEQHEGLVECAIDLRDAVSQAVRERDGAKILDLSPGAPGEAG